MSKISLTAYTGGIMAVIGALFGSFDTALITLVIFMVVDILLGIIDVVWYKRSKYGDKLSSNGLYQGALRKVMELLLVIIAVRLDIVAGTEFIRTGVIFYLIATEGISIIENMARAGVPIPKFLVNILDVMKDENDKGGQGNVSG